MEITIKHVQPDEYLQGVDKWHSIDKHSRSYMERYSSFQTLSHWLKSN